MQNWLDKIVSEKLDSNGGEWESVGQLMGVACVTSAWWRFGAVAFSAIRYWHHDYIRRFISLSPCYLSRFAHSCAAHARSLMCSRCGAGDTGLWRRGRGGTVPGQCSAQPGPDAVQDTSKLGCCLPGCTESAGRLIEGGREANNTSATAANLGMPGIAHAPHGPLWSPKCYCHLACRPSCCWMLTLLPPPPCWRPTKHHRCCATYQLDRTGVVYPCCE